MTYHDHHFHPLGYVSLVHGLELMTATSLDEVLTRVATWAEETTGPLVGQRLNDEGLAEGRLPTRDHLDQAVSDRPVLLYRYCGHIAVANTKMLDLAGIDADTPEPDGGSFDRDRYGVPTGVLRETAVQEVSQALAPLIPPPPDNSILDALATLRGVGLESVTGIVSAGEAIWCGVPDEVETLCRLAPDLPVDIDLLVITGDAGRLTDAKRRIDEAGGRIRFLGWKDFADGSLGGHTAALYEPYADRSDNRGKVRLHPERARVMAKTSLSLGGVAAIHAIGDRANDLVLDVFEDLIYDGADPSRLRIEHASVLTERSIDRMAALGVTASIQPAFLASEEDWLVKRLGEDRMRHAYPFRSMTEAGIRLLGGSDSPVELPDPQVGMTAAVHRHGINPDEALTRHQAEALFGPAGL
jgi:predicted amidohydrolase YtcJ